MKVDQNVEMNDDLLHVQRPEQIEPTQSDKAMNSLSRIVSTSWLQGNDRISTSGYYAGVWCLAIALAKIVRAFIVSPIHGLPIYLNPT